MPHGEIHLQLAVNFADDPKVRALARFGRRARAARDLYVQMLCYCKENLSDGFVPTEQIGILVYPDPPAVGKEDVKHLVDVGLVVPSTGGYTVPGFLRRNKSRQQVRDLSEARSAAGRAGGKRSGESRRNQDASEEESNDEANAKQVASVCLNTESETETKSETEVPTTSGAVALRAVPDESPTTVAQLVAEWIEHCNRRPPASVIAQVGKHIRAMLGEGIDPAAIRNALAMWAAKGLHPSALPSVVNEVMNAGSTPPRQSSNAGILARAMERASAAEGLFP